MDVRLDERLIAVGKLSIIPTIMPDRPQVEYWRIEQGAPMRRAVDETGAIWPPCEPIEPRAARNLTQLPAAGRHDLEAVGERETIALKCQQAVVW
jgi:hypothetical protein